MNIDTGTAMITMSIISLIGMIAVMMMNNANWFKRENFKISKSNLLAENRIKLKKLSKELDVQFIPPAPPQDNNIMDLLKGLDVEKIKGALNLVQGTEEPEYIDIEPERKPDVMEIIAEVVGQNPEIVGQVLGGIKNKAKEGGEDVKKEFPSQVS